MQNLPYPITLDSLSPEDRTFVLNLATLCHGLNLAICHHYDRESKQLPWWDAPQWQRDSSIEGVLYVLGHMEDMKPGILHQQWMNSKKEAGWVYGGVKDDKALTHPCMVPYKDLPVEDRLKDHIFLTTVRTLGSNWRFCNYEESR